MNWNKLYSRSYTKKRGAPKACIIQGASGKYYAGVRIENSSFPVTIPALQSACSNCLSFGDIPEKLIAKERGLEQQDFWLKEFELEVEITSSVDHIQLFETTIDVSEKETPNALIELLDRAVIPNSDFPVSALLFTPNGTITGVNIEVSEWTYGLCAERVALSKAFAYGITHFDKMAIHTKYGQFCSPCGACRQVLSEHLEDHPFEFFHPDGTLSRHYTIDLLPYSFKSSNL